MPVLLMKVAKCVSENEHRIEKLMDVGNAPTHVNNSQIDNVEDYVHQRKRYNLNEEYKIKQLQRRSYATRT